MSKSVTPEKRVREIESEVRFWEGRLEEARVGNDWMSPKQVQKELGLLEDALTDARAEMAERNV